METTVAAVNAMQQKTEKAVSDKLFDFQQQFDKIKQTMDKNVGENAEQWFQIKMLKMEVKSAEGQVSILSLNEGFTEALREVKERLD